MIYNTGLGVSLPSRVGPVDSWHGSVKAERKTRDLTGASPRGTR